MHKTFTAFTAVALTATSSYFLFVYHRLSPISTYRISSSSEIPASLKHSKSTSITNPQNHIPITDTRSITLLLPRHLSDEEILARFVGGFFGGYVFAPERTALKMIRKEITSLECRYPIKISKMRK
jgi:hypothetical protein